MNLRQLIVACALVAVMAQRATADPISGSASPFDAALADPGLGVERVRYYEAPTQPASPSQAPTAPSPSSPPSAPLLPPPEDKNNDGCTKEASCEKKEEECKKQKCKTGCWLLDDFGKSLCKTPCGDCLRGCQKENKANKCGEEEPTCKADEACPSADDDWTTTHLLDDCSLLKKHEIVIGGWLDQSFTWNPQSPRSGINGPVTWEDQSNQYQLNEIYIYGYKEANNDGEGRALGARIDLLYGSNSRFDTSAGLEDHINKSQAFYGLAITQAYLEVAQNDLRATLGHWISPVGYFTVGSYRNFFNTLPYTFQWGEPFTHTGLLTSWTATDKLKLGGGFTRGWDNSGNFNPHLGYIGTLNYTGLAKAGDSLSYVNMWSYEPNGGYQPGTAPGFGANGVEYYLGKPTFSPRYFQTLVYSRPINDKITYVFQSDFGVQGDAAAGTANGSNVARWYGVNQYVYYKASDQWSWGFNGEWFRDEDGFRVAGFLPDYSNTTNGGPSATTGYPQAGYGAGGVYYPGAGGFAGNFYQMTMGPRWTPRPNIVVRPNLRFDWYSGAPGTKGWADPYDDGNKNHQALLITDVVIVF